MKKNICLEIDNSDIRNTENDSDQASIGIIGEQEENQESRKGIRALDFSFCHFISIIFIILIIVGITLKIVFPTVDSLKANIENRKVGKSIVFNFYSLLGDENYSEALKLIDSRNGQFDVESLMEGLKGQLGSTDIIGCDILDVIEKDDLSIINTAVSYILDGQVQTKNQSVNVKNTPAGWKICLDGLVKRFKVNPVLVTVGSAVSFTPEEIEYCEEGINLKLKVKNNTYKKVDLNGDITLETTNGDYNEEIKTNVKSHVQYYHNLLFTNANGEPKNLIISLDGKNFEKSEIPVEIIR